MGGEIGYGELLEEKAAKLGDKPFLRFEDELVTYKQMDERANRVANGLLKMGVGPGVGVANMIPNSPETLYVHFAIQKIGAYSVPVNTELKGEHLAYILDHSDSRVLLTSHSLLPSFEKIRHDCPKIEHVVVTMRDSDPIMKLGPGLDAFENWMVMETADRPGQHPEEGGISMIMYTSGTTGRAKGVIYRYGKLGIVRIGLLAKVFYKPEDVLFTVLPLFHANALYVSLPSSLFAEAGLALGTRFSASKFWDTTRKHGATAFNALGAMIPILMKQPEKPDDADNPVKLVLSAACPAALWEKFEKRFGVKIYEFYGAVDGGGNALFNMGNCPIGSIGKLPRPNAKIIDEQGNDVGPQTPGELVFQIPEKQKVVEYYKNEEATQAKLKDGLLHTGDLVYCDKDDYVYFVDRKSDNMRRRGENISSYEVEKTVERFPSVLEAAAYAIKSEIGEDDVMVAVAPKPGETIDPVALYKFCAEEMPRYMIPRYLRVVDEFEKTETHRIVKAPLKEQGVTPDTWDEEKEMGRRK